MNKRGDEIINYMVADILARPEIEKISVAVNLDLSGINEEEKESRRAEEIEDFRVYFSNFAARHWRFDIKVTDRATGNTIFECKGAPTFMERLSLIYNRPVSVTELNKEFLKKFGIVIPETTSVEVNNNDEPENEVVRDSLKRHAEEEGGDEKPKKIRYLRKDNKANKDFLKKFKQTSDVPVKKKTLEEREAAIKKMLATKMREKKKLTAQEAADRKREMKEEKIKRDRELKAAQKTDESDNVIVFSESPEEPPQFLIRKDKPKRDFVSQEPSTSYTRKRSQKQKVPTKKVKTIADQNELYTDMFHTPMISQLQIKKKSALEILSDEEAARKRDSDNWSEDEPCTRPSPVKLKKTDPDTWSEDEVQPSPKKLRGKNEKDDKFKMLKEVRAQKLSKTSSMALTKNQWIAENGAELTNPRKSPELFADDTIDLNENHPHFDDLPDGTFESHTKGIYFKNL